MAIVTVSFIDLPNYLVSVRTDANKPVVGVGLTPAEAMAMELAGTAFSRRAEVIYDPRQVPAIALAMDLLDPEGLGHAVPQHVHDRARRALGKVDIDRPPKQRMDIDRIHRAWYLGKPAS